MPDRRPNLGLRVDRSGVMNLRRWPVNGRGSGVGGLLEATAGPGQSGAIRHPELVADLLDRRRCRERAGLALLCACREHEEGLGARVKGFGWKVRWVCAGEAERER
jgi:hypothetical protein